MDAKDSCTPGHSGGASSGVSWDGPSCGKPGGGIWRWGDVAQKLRSAEVVGGGTLFRTIFLPSVEGNECFDIVAPTTSWRTSTSTPLWRMGESQGRSEPTVHCQRVWEEAEHFPLVGGWGHQEAWAALQFILAEAIINTLSHGFQEAQVGIEVRKEVEAGGSGPGWISTALQTADDIQYVVVGRAGLGSVPTTQAKRGAA